jgi:hypothetical protein
MAPPEEAHLSGYGELHRHSESVAILTPRKGTCNTGEKNFRQAGKHKIAESRSDGRSKMETIAQLGIDFAGIEIMGSAAGEAVVEQNAAVSDVQGIRPQGELFAEVFGQRKIESGVRLKMAVEICRRISVRKTRAVISGFLLFWSAGARRCFASLQMIGMRWLELRHRGYRLHYFFFSPESFFATWTFSRYAPSLVTTRFAVMESPG